MRTRVSNSPKPAQATPLNPRRRGIIVGASDGMGAALARKLAKEGYTLALIARRQDKLASLCAEINAAEGEARALAYAHDVSNYDEVPNLLRKITAELGGLDLLVFMAGANFPPGLNSYNFEGDRKMIEVNLIGAMAWLSPVAEMFQSAKAGQIVGISSVAGDRGRVGNPGYNTSKAALPPTEVREPKPRLPTGRLTEVRGPRVTRPPGAKRQRQKRRGWLVSQKPKPFLPN